MHELGKYSGARGVHSLHDHSPGWILGLGISFLGIGIAIGSMKVSSDCGSLFSPESRVARLTDAMMYVAGVGFGPYEAACREDIAAATVFTWALIALGVLTTLTWLIVRAITGPSTSNRA